MRPVGVHHVSLNVRDVDAALAFYTDVLGFAVRTDRPDFGFGGAWLDVGPQQVHLIEGETPDNKGQHFAVQVVDLAATVAELRDKGVTVSDPVAVSTSLQAFLNDPSGNTIELHQIHAVGPQDSVQHVNNHPISPSS
ncbi:MAG TPA: VOC family protein [Acidimicrobiales bacterium]|nr:VOC family protein [Acidimicrobiales bacterium]